MELKKLTEVCSPKQWKTISQTEMLPEGYPVYGANGIIGYYNEYNHENPTVLITCRGATCGTLNISKPFSYVNGNAMALDNVIEDVDEKYLYYYLQSRGLKDIISGSAQPQITIQNLTKVIVSYPSIEEQKRIVSMLDKADEIRAKKKLANDKLDEFLKSTFISMFGDTVINPKKWNIEPLNQYIDFMTSGSRGWAKYYSEQGEIFIRIGNVRNAELDLSDIQYVNAPNNKEAERTKVKTNDLLISITADLGRTAVIDEATAMKGAYINQHLCLVRLKDANPVYIAHYMQNEFCKRQIKQLDQVGVKSGLNFEAIKNLKIIVPPIEQQNKFAQIVEKVEAQKQKNELVIEQMNNLFNSLSQQAFKGEL